MNIEKLIADYGYLAVFVATFLEGETVLVMAGFAASLGLLDFPLVLLTAAAGGFLGDQFYFYLGRRHGQAILAKRPAMRERVERIDIALLRYQNLLIFGCRFMYGFRTVIPFTMGLGRVSAFTFMTWNLIGAIVWSIAVGTIGFMFGDIIEEFLGDLREYEHAAMLVIAIAGAGVWLYRHLRRKVPVPLPPKPPE